MAPDVSRERMVGYIALGASAFLSLIFWFIFSSDGKLELQVERAEREYQRNQRQSVIPFATLLTEQRDANERLQVLVDSLKISSELKQLHRLLFPMVTVKGTAFI